MEPPTLVTTPSPRRKASGTPRNAATKNAGLQSPSERNTRRPRIRASIACQICRDKKVRCSGDDPCSQCATRGHICVFPKVDNRKGHRAIISKRSKAKLAHHSGCLVSISSPGTSEHTEHHGDLNQFTEDYRPSQPMSRHHNLPRGRPKISVSPCSFCNKRFRRTEHLRRHERTHTQEKPYGCTCGQNFSRQDLLARHKRINHGENETVSFRNQSNGTPYRKQKPIQNDKDPSVREESLVESIESVAGQFSVDEFLYGEDQNDFNTILPSYLLENDHPLTSFGDLTPIPPELVSNNSSEDIDQPDLTASSARHNENEPEQSDDGMSRHYQSYPFWNMRDDYFMGPLASELSLLSPDDIYKSPYFQTHDKHLDNSASLSFRLCHAT